MAGAHSFAIGQAWLAICKGPAVKATEWKRAVRPLLPADERWEFRGRLCYRAPAGLFLFGVFGDGSAYDTGVLICRVVMPLFVPREVLDLSYSKRVGGGMTLHPSREPAAFQAAIQSALDAPSTELAELLHIVELSQDSMNLHVLHAAAASAVLLGEETRALKIIERTKRFPPPQYQWVADVHERIREMEETLTQRGIWAAIGDLERQRRQTATALGLVHDKGGSATTQSEG